MSSKVSDISKRVSNLLPVLILGALLKIEFRFLADLEGWVKPLSSVMLLFLLLAVADFGLTIFWEGGDRFRHWRRLKVADLIKNFPHTSY